MRCQICRQPSSRLNPIVRCSEPYPWPTHCTICKSRCGECQARRPSYERVVSRRTDAYGTHEWEGWVLAS